MKRRLEAVFLKQPQARTRRLAGLGLFFILASCGGANTSGMALGKVGEELRVHADSVPQGGDVCLIQDAMAAQAGAAAPVSDACTKALKNDHLWRKAFITLSAYGEMLEGLASGEEKENAGKLQAAETGVDGDDFSGIDGAEATSGRDAVQGLVKVMQTGDADGDLGKVIKSAAPHVKAICEGLSGYLEKTAKTFHDLQQDLEKKRTSKSDLRCGQSNGQTMCVGDSSGDRSVYANMYGQLDVLADAHKEANGALGGFCAAHKKLEEAADAGNLKSDDTYKAVVDAVKSGRGGGSGSSGSVSSGSSPASSSAPSSGPAK
jgi:hypothetical protein